MLLFITLAIIVVLARHIRYYYLKYKWEQRKNEFLQERISSTSDSLKNILDVATYHLNEEMRLSRVPPPPIPASTGRVKPELPKNAKLWGTDLPLTVKQKTRCKKWTR